jgi:general secretion pathway protein C
MDVAKNFANWRDRSPEQWIARANQVLPPIVVALLVVVIAYQAASLTRRLLEAPAVQTAVPMPAPAPASESPASPGSYGPLHGWKPFGEPPAPGELLSAAPADFDNLPTTTLPHRLWGTNGASKDPWASATISSDDRGSQFTYFIGDTIKDANGATLVAVFPTEVVLEFPDRHREILPLPDAEEMARAGGRSQGRRLTASPAPAQAQPQALLTRAVQTQEALSSAAALLQNNVRIVPKLENGQTVGFVLTPTGNAEIFDELGFEPGDVLTEVNGIRLSDPANLPRAFSALAESAQTQATIRRNDQMQTIVVDMSKIQTLMESRQ